MSKTFRQLAVLYAGTLGFFLFFHVGKPFAFTFGDNLVQFLPAARFAAETLFAGHLPLWNPYQLLGSPLAALGYYGAFHPPLYLAYALTKLLFLPTYYLFEVFAGMHALAAAGGFFHWLRRKGVGGWTCVLFALTYALSGLNVNYGAEWFYLWPTIAFLPWLALLLDRTLGDPSRKHCLTLAFAIASYFYSGNFQFCFLAVFYLALYALGTGRMPLRRLLFTGAVTAVLASPFLYLMVKTAAASFFRSDRILYEKFLGASVEPWTWLTTVSGLLPATPADLSITTRFTTTYLAALNLLVLPALLMGAALKKRGLLFVGLFALLMSFGEKGLLYPLFFHVPVFNRFTHAFKHLFYANFFLVGFAAMSLDFWASKATRTAARAALTALGVVAALGVLYNGRQMVRATLWAHASDRLTDPFIDVRSPIERFAVLQTIPKIQTSEAHACTQYLAYNCATFVRRLTIGGYETAISSYALHAAAENWYANVYERPTREVGELFKVWGVNGAIVPRDAGIESIALRLGLDPKRVTRTATTDEVSLLHFEEVPPVHRIGDGEVTSMIYHGDGFDLGIRATHATKLTSGFLYWPYFRASIAETGEAIAVGEDAAHRLRLELPAGNYRLRVRYRDARSALALAASLFAFLGIFFMLASDRANRTRTSSSR